MGKARNDIYAYLEAIGFPGQPTEGSMDRRFGIYQNMIDAYSTMVTPHHQDGFVYNFKRDSLIRAMEKAVFEMPLWNIRTDAFTDAGYILDASYQLFHFFNAALHLSL
jgi:hypothetical protein